MTLAFTLWHLQTLDQERADKLRRADQIAQALTNDPRLAAARAALDDESDRLARLRGELQAAELEGKSLDAKIKELETRLSSGRVTNPKELDALEKDRQMHLRHRSDLDTRLLELMDALERARKEADERDAALKKTEAIHTAATHKLEGERAALAARVAQIESERGATRAALTPDAIAAYDRLRHAKAGRAVARLKNNGCGVCGMQIPSGLRARAEEDEDLVFCPECGRILAA